jgi:hypothetical protein
MAQPKVTQGDAKSSRRWAWGARAAVLVVFTSNLSAAVPFVLRPARFAGGFELAGTAGNVVVRSIGLLFVMWVVPYVPALLAPVHHRICFPVIVAQQLIGLMGESWMWLNLPAGHAALRATGRRFILFDAVGLILLLAAWWMAHQAAVRAMATAPSRRAAS